MIEQKIKNAVNDIPDFPKPGILFKDITPILNQPILVGEIVEAFVQAHNNFKIDAIAAVESRGYYFGPLLSQKLQVPLIPVRKAGKLPGSVVSYSYDLEYGSATVEIQRNSINKNANVLVHDDLLATGGTAAAAAELILSQNANVIGFSFLVNLSFLNGKEKLKPYSNNIVSLANYK